MAETKVRPCPVGQMRFPAENLATLCLELARALCSQLRQNTIAK